jgi:hypothetical protein
MGETRNVYKALAAKPHGKGDVRIILEEWKGVLQWSTCTSRIRCLWFYIPHGTGRSFNRNSGILLQF